MVSNSRPSLPEGDHTLIAGYRLARMVARREARWLSVPGLVISVTMVVVAAGMADRRGIVAALAIGALNVWAHRAGGPMARACAMQLAVVALAWCLRESAPAGVFFVPAAAVLAAFPLQRIAALAGALGLTLHLAIAMAEGPPDGSFWWFVATGVATLSISVLWSRERTRFVHQCVTRRHTRVRREREVTEELQRARLVERRLVEVATNLRLTQDQLEHDVKRRQAMADQLSVAMVKAEEANRAKSEFLARMSHELRTPLNSVIGFSSLLRKNAAPRLQARELQYLDRINANGSHLLELLSDILDISRIEAGRMAVDIIPVSIAPLLREAVDLLQPPGAPPRDGVVLRLEVPDEECIVDADPARLRQVVLNLVGNALKFTKRGEIVVSLFLNRHGAPDRVEVRDTGMGIPADRQRAVFEPFEQADNSTARQHGGSGLGLAISRQLCTLMGMTLTLQSSVGVGSTFAVHFAPAARATGTSTPSLMPAAT